MERDTNLNPINKEETTKTQDLTLDTTQAKDAVQSIKIPKKYSIINIFLALLVLILSFTTIYFYSSSSNNNKESKISVSENAKDAIQQISPTLTPTITTTPLSTASADLADVSKVLDDIVANYPNFNFRKIKSRVFEYQIDETTKKIILGTAYESEITGDKDGVETEIYNEFLSLGFVDGMYNSAGPDFGAVRYGVQKDNIVCIIKTGFPYSATPDARMLDLDCGYLEQ